MKIFISAILCALVQFSAAGLCSYNYTVSGLPNSVLKEIKNIIDGQHINEITNCRLIDYASEQVNLWLYTRNNTSDSIKLVSTDTSLLKGRKTILITHGYYSSHQQSLLVELRDAYLKRYDANIIAIDWRAYARDNYANVFCNVPRIAKTVAELLCKADSESNIDIADLHVLGHSMGGQLAGLIGQETQAQCSQVLGRISGLDPAGPIYKSKPESERLDASDAKEVMVIHTNTGTLGYMDRCGTVDFYPNGGLFQDGCSIFDSPDNVNGLAYSVACSHSRAICYMTESISSNNFHGKGCYKCLGKGVKAIMGEDLSYDKESCSYCMNVNDEPPFGRGPRWIF